MSILEEGASVRKRSDYQRAVKQWEQLSRKDGLTKPGNHWLLQSLDGFHDSPITPVDFPDGIQGNILVHEVTREASFGKPPGLTAGANWDLHVTTNGFAGGTNGICGFDNALGVSGVTDRAQVGLKGVNASLAAWSGGGPVAAPVMMNRVAGGTPTFNSPSVTGGIGAVDIPQEYLKGPCRVVGMALELVNTTPELYVNGSCTAYSVPARYERYNTIVQGTEAAGAQVYLGGGLQGALANAVNVDTPMLLIAEAAPPQTVATAALAHNSELWPAKEGGYINAVFEEPPKMDVPRPFLPAWYDTDVTVGSDTQILEAPWPSMQYSPGAITRVVNSSRPSVATGGLGTGTVDNYQFDFAPPRVVHVPIKRQGLYLTGLNENSTFTLRVRFFIARVPSINEGQLYTLARPAPIADPEAWELYTTVSPHIPAAAMFTENPLGEWFGKVLGAVRDWAPKIGAAVGTVVPGANLLGNAIGTAAGIGKQMVKAGRGDAKAKAKLSPPGDKKSK